MPSDVASPQSAVLHRTLHFPLHRVTHASGHYVYLDDGRRVLDSTGGAAVSSIGHGHPEVLAALAAQHTSLSYVASLFFTHAPGEELASLLVDSTGGALSHVLVVGSGSEAVESALKLARQYHLEKGEARRTHFIARRPSYHGNTLGALAVGGHTTRRRPYEPLLATSSFSWVGLANAYRGMKRGESVEGYVARLKQELEDEFARAGPDTVCAVIIETVVGAAAGCITPPPGYLAAVRSVCDAHGALLILDEVMSGMGRCGTMHAWQAEGVAPDLQTLGKGLGGGYAPVAALLASPKVADVLRAGSGAFVNGFTYQGHPASCAAAVAVQKVVIENGLVERARTVGEKLGARLVERLSPCDGVGQVRGRGMFWGIEIVADKDTKQPFPPAKGVASRIQEAALAGDIPVLLYPGQGCVDGVNGDHLIVAPPYTITLDEIDVIIAAAKKAIQLVIKEVRTEDQTTRPRL